jgi:hypothetical protein
LPLSRSLYPHFENSLKVFGAEVVQIVSVWLLAFDWESLYSTLSCRPKQGLESMREPFRKLLLSDKVKDNFQLDFWVFTYKLFSIEPEKLELRRATK